ncbi:hypothetical protein HY375_00460 [Candidatus Berkelbacteria bacterium]|nr:hypothetical protein [Candidatus Berkelbacteria bacterium]
MQVTVRLNKIPFGARKLRAILDQVRGRTVPMALARLSASPRVTTLPLEKLLRSAISAARDRDPATRPEELTVVAVACNEGARLYRTRIKSRGRSSRFAKRSSRLVLTVGKAARAPQPAPISPKPTAATPPSEPTAPTASVAPPRRRTKESAPRRPTAPKERA